MIKKVLKVISYTILVIIISGIGFGIYKYQTDDMLRAMINQDESKLSYGPLKEIVSLKGFDFEEYKLEVNDSIKIYTYLFKPSIQPIGNIFYIHGSGGNAAYWSSLYKPLIDAGYNVYAADWRGYGKATGSPNYKGVLEDTEIAFKDFLHKTKKDGLKNIVYGMSLGGQLAIKITKDNQENVDALVLDSAFESAQKIAIDYAPFEFLKNRARNHPENFNQLYVGSRDIKSIRNIPKLIIHSSNDLQVSITHGENLFKNANEPKEFWKTKTSHIMTLQDEPKEAIKKINRLIR